MSVYKPAKSRFYHYDFVSKGRRFHGSTQVETRRKAEEVERNLRSKIALGVDPNAEMSLDDAADRWWEEVGKDLRTAVDIHRRLETLTRLIGGGTKLSDITTSRIANAIQRRRGETYSKTAAKGAKRYLVSNATVNADVPDLMRRILRRARKTWEVRGLPEIDWTSLRLPEPAPKVRAYTAAQQSGWLAECDDTAAFALRLLFTYGLRFGELFFRPSAYDPDGPRLILNFRKGDVPHVVPLRADDARQIAARVGRAAAAGLDRIWFEENERGELVIVTYYGMQARMRSAAKRAGLTMDRLIHGARHHAGTTTLRRTQNLKLTQQLLGHANIQSTMRYAHALEDDLRAALEQESRNSPEPEAPEAEFVVPKQRRRR